MASIYFSGQGIVYVADRATDGTISTFVDVGNCPNLVLTLETEVSTHKESRTGQRLEDFRLTTSKSGTISMTLEEIKKSNLEFMLYGTGQDASVTAVTNESIGVTGLTAGDIITTSKYPFVSAGFAVKDSALIPATLVLNTDYEILDRKAGLVKLLNVSGFTQPFKFDYTPEAADIVTMFTQPAKERLVRFSGLNTANSDDPVIVDLYRVIFDPAANVAMINDELAQFELEGSVLFDSTREPTASLGGYGRIINAELDF